MQPCDGWVALQFWPLAKQHYHKQTLLLLLLHGYIGLVAKAQLHVRLQPHSRQEHTEKS